MPRSWHDLFVTGEGSDPQAGPSEGSDADSSGFFRRLRQNMRKTREALRAELQSTLFQTLDDAAWEQLEETLIYADVGATTTANIVARLEQEVEGGTLEPGEPFEARLRELLAEAARADGDGTIDIRPRPTVILMVGVNGTGKTTTIGKIAWHLRN